MTDAQKAAQKKLAKKEGELEGRDKGKKEGSLRIHIELDLEVEVHITARVKGGQYSVLPYAVLLLLFECLVRRLSVSRRYYYRPFVNRPLPLRGDDEQETEGRRRGGERNGSGSSS